MRYLAQVHDAAGTAAITHANEATMLIRQASVIAAFVVSLAACVIDND
jgi:hypothetical protein